MTRRTSWIIALVLLLGLAALAVRGLQARRATGAPGAAPAAASAASAVPAALQLDPTDVFVARAAPLTRTLALSGSLEAVNTAVVKAKVTAELQSLTVREGDPVRAGQVIGQIDTTEATLRAQQAAQTAESSRAQLEIAQRALENNRALVAQGFISPTGLQTSVSNEAAARASYQAALAAVSLARKAVADARLVAPISGTVSQRLVQPGERLPLDGRVVEIVDLSRIEMEAPVAPEVVGAVRVGQAARLEVDGLPEPVAATVVRINPSTQAGTRAVMVYLALAPHPALRQGLFARGTIALSEDRALAVPVSAVRIDQPRPYVFVLADGRVSRRLVALGARGEVTSAGRREPAVAITEGLADGAVVLRATVGAVREGTPAAVSGAAPPASGPVSATVPAAPAAASAS